MRWTLPASILICVAAIAGCGRLDATAQRHNGDVDLDQGVTNSFKPEDIIFKDFAGSWRQFISSSPEIALPVVVRQPARPPVPVQPWLPVELGECVFSPGAGGQVPQVTLNWNDPVSGGSDTADSAQEQSKSDAAKIRFDLTLHHDGFSRNYFTTALASDKLKRFNLPQNSGLVKDTDAVLLTGPGLFPVLTDFRTEALQERDSPRRFLRRTLILRDLSPGLSYAIRRSTIAQSSWDEQGQFLFLTPVCPNSF